MANVLKVDMRSSIVVLKQRGFSLRCIARMLGLDRETVTRYVRLHATEQLALPGESPPKPATISTTGSEGATPEPARVSTAGSGPSPAGVSTAGLAPWSEAKPATISTAGSEAIGPGMPPDLPAGRPSKCSGLAETIERLADQGLSAVRIHQELRDAHGFTGSYQSVKRFVRRVHGIRPELVRRLECEPGEELQLDFGRGAPVDDGQHRKRRRPWLFRAVLSHSRKAYSEVVWHQDTDTLLRVLENAFRAFGGVPTRLILDNLKAGVIQADWHDPELNHKLEMFCRHYGTVALPNRPRTPRHKGKIERGVGYAQGNALKARVFPSLEAQNVFLAHWEATVADTRIHGTTRRQVREMFEAERPHLRPLAAESFPNFRMGRRIVGRDGHIEVEKAYYSVPAEYLRREVWACWDTRLVRILNERFQPVAVHCRVPPGKFDTSQGHIPPERIAMIERGDEFLLRQAARLGADCERWGRELLQERGIVGLRVLQGLLGLARRHPGLLLNEACRTAVEKRLYRLRDLRRLLERRQADRDRQLPLPLADHPLIRPLQVYQRLVAAPEPAVSPVLNQEPNHA